MQPIIPNAAKKIQVNAPSSPELKPNIVIERDTERWQSIFRSPVSLSERRVTCKKQLQIFDIPELYIQIKDWDRNPIVFPFMLDGRKHLKIDPDTALVNHDCSLEVLGDNKENLHGWCEAMGRLSNIFTHGFKNVCEVTVSEDKKYVIDGHCHHFVNYLAFGMNKQEDISFSGWYEDLPFSLLLQFDEKDLKWGDIVQLSAQSKLKHSMFYIGNGKYINKHGSGEIYFQDLKNVQKSYPSDSVRIIRVSQNYYSAENIFKGSYS